MEELNTPEKIAQWVIDNRYPKTENNKVNDFEMFNIIKDSINEIREIDYIWYPEKPKK